MISIYPEINSDKDIVPFLREITRLREQEDIPDYINLDQRFLAGRASNRVPSSSTDVLATDSLGDVVNDATYEYKLVNISGVYKWDRRTLNTSW